MLGKPRGAASLRRAPAEVIDIVFCARPSAISIEAANPRHAHEWKLFETLKLPEGIFHWALVVTCYSHEALVRLEDADSIKE